MGRTSPRYRAGVTNGWNIAEIFADIADAIPDAPALRHGGIERSWSDMDRRAHALAKAMLDAGAAEQSKVAQYLYNGPEYIESVLGALPDLQWSTPITATPPTS